MGINFRLIMHQVGAYTSGLCISLKHIFINNVGLLLDAERKKIVGKV